MSLVQLLKNLSISGIELSIPDNPDIVYESIRQKNIDILSEDKYKNRFIENPEKPGTLITFDEYINKGPYPVKLFPDQVENVTKIIEILSKNLWACETTTMGGGKTHMISFIEQYFRFKNMIVIGPVSVESVWAEAKDRYGLPLRYISYDTLRGNKKSSTLSHGLLSRINDECVSNSSSFVHTQMLDDLINEGTFFVFDEFSRTKNTSAIHYAVKAIIWRIISFNTTSRIVLMSGSPFDKDKQIVDFMRMMGIIRHRNLYNTTRSGNIEISGHGAGDLYSYCMDLDSQTTQDIVYRNPFNKNDIEKICTELYVHVIQKFYVTSMAPPQIEVPINCCNGYYNLSRYNSEKLSESIRKLGNIAKYNSVTDTIDSKETEWISIATVLIAVEFYKIEIFVRKAYETLINVENSKVILAFNYRISIKCSSLLLRQFNPLILDGDMPKSKRSNIINAFQSHNNTHRLIITNVSVAALGIDLDDTLGIYPRYMFISPGYHAPNAHQMTRRVYRRDTKSTPYVRFVYGKCGVYETSILNSLSRKKDVFHKTLPKQVENGIKFPGEYDKEEEPDDENLGTISYAIYENECSIADINVQECHSDEEKEDIKEIKKRNRRKIQPIVPIILEPNIKKNFELPK